MLLLFLEFEGKVVFKDIQEGISYRVESDETTGFEEKVMIDRKDKTLNPTITISNDNDETRNVFIVFLSSAQLYR